MNFISFNYQEGCSMIKYNLECLVHYLLGGHSRVLHWKLLSSPIRILCGTCRQTIFVSNELQYSIQIPNSIERINLLLLLHRESPASIYSTSSLMNESTTNTWLNQQHSTLFSSSSFSYYTSSSSSPPPLRCHASSRHHSQSKKARSKKQLLLTWLVLVSSNSC